MAIPTTGADLRRSAGRPAFRPSSSLFLCDIDAPRDFSQRDLEVERIYAFLSRVMPAQTVQLLTDVIALNRVRNVLDDDLCRVLVDQLG